MDPNKESNRHPEIASWNRRTPRTADVVRLLASWVLTFLALLLTAELLPGFTYTSWRPLVAAAAVTGLVGMIVRPVLVAAQRPDRLGRGGAGHDLRPGAS